MTKVAMTIEATNDTFEQEVLQSNTPVLVDFWAPWCGPCKAIAPAFESVSAEQAGKIKFVKVNVDDTTVASKYGVRGIPTLMMFKDGQVVKTKSGAMTKAQIAEFVA